MKDLLGSLRQDILMGTFPAGIPVAQEDLAARYGVSRQPIRSALDALYSEGLLVRHGKRGLAVPSLSAVEAEDLYLMRAELEPLALTLGAPHLTKEVLGRAEDVLDALDTETGVLERGRLNWEFHKTLYEVGRRPRMLDTLERLHQHAERYMSFQFDTLNNHEVSQKDHRDILKACRAGDIDRAAGLMRTHVVKAGRQLVQALEGDPAQLARGPAPRIRK
jgi:DNA-binding GntR family transcriptional regulator